MKIHFIGIAGVAIAPLAKMMKDFGWEVTGSDEEVFEPMLSFLEKNGLEWQEGFEAQRVHGADLAIINGAAILKHPDNVEVAEAKKLGIPSYGYPYLLNKYIAKKNSIVVTGSVGKTTTSCIIAWLFDYCGLNPAFMTGGQPLNFEAGVRYTESEYSVLEGDEFASAFGFDNEPKFIYYKPTHSIITSAKWDHLNLYPTEDSYVEAFRKLLRCTKENNGLVLINSAGDNNDILHSEITKGLYGDLKDKIFTYSCEQEEKFTTSSELSTTIEGSVSLSSNASVATHYRSEIINNPSDKTYTHFVTYKNDKEIGQFSTTMIGRSNVEDFTAAIAMCDILGLDLKKVAEGVKQFKGIKRRQEIRGTNSKGAVIMDDLAHSTIKAKATLEALRTRYKTEKIIAVFDPHASSLADRKSLEWYKGAFDGASEVIIPKIIVKKSTPKDKRVYATDIIDAIKVSQPNVRYIPIDDDIVKYLEDISTPDTLIVFMSSGGWRGIIEKVLEG